MPTTPSAKAIVVSGAWYLSNSYALAIHKDVGSDYGVTAPDLPGCFSAGDSIDDAITAAAEAIGCHLEGRLMDGDPIPLANSIEKYQQSPNYRDSDWFWVEVDISQLAEKVQHTNW